MAESDRAAHPRRSTACARQRATAAALLRDGRRPRARHRRAAAARDEARGRVPVGAHGARAAGRRGDRRPPPRSWRELEPRCPRRAALIDVIEGADRAALERAGRGPGPDRQRPTGCARALRPRLRRLPAGRRVSRATAAASPFLSDASARRSGCETRPRPRPRSATSSTPAWRCRAARLFLSYRDSDENGGAERPRRCSTTSCRRWLDGRTPRTIVRARDLGAVVSRGRARRPARTSLRGRSPPARGGRHRRRQRPGAGRPRRPPLRPPRRSSGGWQAASLRRARRAGAGAAREPGRDRGAGARPRPTAARRWRASTAAPTAGSSPTSSPRAARPAARPARPGRADARGARAPLQRAAGRRRRAPARLARRLDRARRASWSPRRRRARASATHPAERAIRRRVERLLAAFLAEEADRPARLRALLLEARFGSRTSAERPRSSSTAGGCTGRSTGSTARRTAAPWSSTTSSSRAVTRRAKFEEQAKLQLQLYLIAVASSGARSPRRPLPPAARRPRSRAPARVAAPASARRPSPATALDKDVVDDERVRGAARGRAGRATADRRPDPRRRHPPRPARRHECPTFCTFAPICRRDRGLIADPEEELREEER